MQTIRVLHIMSSFGGGISTFIHNLAQSAPEQKLIFDVVTFHPVPDYFEQAIQATGGQIYRMENPKQTSWWAFKASFNKPFQDHTYQVVYCHISGYRSWIYARLTRQFQRTPLADFYVHAHYRFEKKSFFSWKERLDRLFNRRLSRLPIGCSSVAVKDLFDLNEQASYVVVPNSIEAENFHFSTSEQDQAQKAWRQHFSEEHQSDFIIGQVGRLEPVKNHLFSLQLIRYSHSQEPSFNLIIAGEGKERKKLIELSESLGLDEWVYFAGRISPIGELLAGLDAIIMPSLSEGFGTIAIEAQAAGIPVLASHQVPKDVDLGIGLFYSLSLEESVTVWYEQLIKAIENNQEEGPDFHTRLMAIQKKSFTNEAASHLFRQVLSHQVDHFQLDER